MSAASGEKVLLLDAGNTLVFLDFEAVAAVLAAEGVTVEPTRLAAAETGAKARYQALLAEGGSHEDGWRVYQRLLLEGARVQEDLERLVDALRRAHDRFNLWRRVPPEVRPALRKAREAGVRLGIVSNSEGRLVRLLERLALLDFFETVVDSGVEGIRKPDPRIFHRALERMGVSDALYAGDIPDVDVEGARAAGLRGVLVDPAAHFPDFIPRVDHVGEVVEGLLVGEL